MKCQGVLCEHVQFVGPEPVTPTLQDATDECYSSEAWSETYRQFLSQEDGITPPLRVLLGRQYPRSQRGVCAANSLSSFVIEPNGDVKACWEDVGQPGSACGNITTYSYRDLAMHHSRIGRVIKTLQLPETQCWECAFLPACMGGCIDKRDTWRHRCPPFKFHTAEWIRLYAEKMVERSPSETSAMGGQRQHSSNV